MESLRFQLVKALKRAKHCHGARLGVRRASYAEIPMSMSSFQKFVIQKVPEINMTNNCARTNISLADLRAIIGNGYDCLVEEKSCTVQRMLGSIRLFYRPRVNSIFSNENCLRYQPFYSTYI